MSFTDAVRDGLTKYATFSGRSSRSAYWWFYLFTVIVYISASIIDVAIGVPVFSALAFLGLFLPGLAVLVRRFHDAGHSAWWLLLALVPIVGFIVWLIFALTDSQPPNQWGTGPDQPAGAAVGAPPLAQTPPPPPSEPPAPMPPPAPNDRSPE